jgi:hypothetical protein
MTLADIPPPGMRYFPIYGPLAITLVSPISSYIRFSLVGWQNSGGKKKVKNGPEDFVFCHVVTVDDIL